MKRKKHSLFLICFFAVVFTFISPKDSFAQGDITAVHAGTGLTGGGDTGDVNLSVKVPLDLNGVSMDAIIKGTNTNVSDIGIGVSGITHTKKGMGIYGKNTRSSNYGHVGSEKTGVYGYSENGAGVVGTSKNYTGVQGSTSGTRSVGVSGNNSINGGTHGYIGGSSVGVHGKHNISGNWGNLGDTEYGVYGHSVNNIAVYGKNSTNTNFGYLGSSDYGVYGKNYSSGNFGYLGSRSYGMYGESNTGHAVHGHNTGNDNTGILGGNDFGVFGKSNSIGVRGFNSRSHTTGELGGSNYGACGYGSGNSDGVHGISIGSGTGVYGRSNSGFAGKFEGNLMVTGQGIVNVLHITGGSDLSEQFKIRGNKEDLLPKPGMVVSIDPENPGDLVISNKSYDRRVAGIMSGAGGVQAGMLMGQQGSKADGANPVALTGRVYVWADALKNPITPGDLLTTSNIPGHAMKVTDYTRAQGAILGKAMSSLDKSKGLVLVLVALQ